MGLLFRRMLILLSLFMIFSTVQPAWPGIVNIGELITITGTVYECEAKPSGIQIQVDDNAEIISVYGMGPVRYWATQGAEFPEVGEMVTINAYEITFSDGTVKYVADSVDLDLDGNVDIDLRDDNGRPLWRQQARNCSQAQYRHRR